MSYPGYPPYPPQGAGQPSPNPTSAPMYQTNPVSYPGYPGAAAPPFSTYPGQHTAPYPGMNPTPGSYPQAPYPSANQPYPSASASPYPAANPPTTSPYPSTGSPYPPTGSPYPSNTGSPYSSTTSSQYPPTGSQYPPTGSQYPPTSSPYPQGSPFPASPYQASPYPSSGSAPVHGASPAYPPQHPASHLGQTAPTASNYSSGYQGTHSSSGYGGSRATATAPLHSQPHLSAHTATRAICGIKWSRHNKSAPQPSRTSSLFPNICPTPTVIPANPFNPRSDAEALRKAMKGFGTDEKTIIDILTKRTNSQRQQIAIEFKTLYGKDLVSDLKSEVSGKFEELLVALMTPTYDFLAKELHHAVSGVGTKEETLVEIICTTNNYEMKCIKAAYEKLYGVSLEQELAGDTSGNFRRLLVSLCQGNRNETYGADPNSTAQDAQALLRAGELKVGTDESTFNAILCTRSYSQLAAIFAEYHRIAGNDLVSAIKSEFSGDIERGLVAVVRSVQDKSEFFAKELHESMAGAGTYDRSLIRIICSRSEIDLGDIKNAYQRKYGKMLSEAIHGDTSGNYKKALLSLIN